MTRTNEIELTVEGAQEAIRTHLRVVDTTAAGERLRRTLAEAQAREVECGARVAEENKADMAALGAGRLTLGTKRTSAARAALTQATAEREMVEGAIRQNDADKIAAQFAAREELFPRALGQLKPEAAALAAMLEALEARSRPFIRQLEATRPFQRGIGASNALADHCGSPLQNVVGRIADLLGSWRANGLIEG